jgi:DNA replication protein DnaC
MIKPRMTVCLKQLHLPAFVEHYAPQAALAGNEGWPYDRYLLGLCELELAERDARRIQHLLKDSKLPREKTLEAFDRTRIKKAVDRQFAVLLEGDFLNRRENVLAFGNPGSGKTHLLCALGHELVRKGRSVYFVPCALLVQRLLLAKAELWLEKERSSVSTNSTLSLLMISVTSSKAAMKWRCSSRCWRTAMNTAACC